MMKKALLFTAVIALAVFSGCEPENKHKTATTHAELEDPVLTVKGVPATLDSGSSFNLTVSSKSSAAITVTNNKPALVSVTSNGEGKFTVSATSSSDADVVLTVSQQENKDYASASKNVSFKVKGQSAGSLPGPSDAVDGTAVTFEEAEGEVMSPERGMYRGLEIRDNTPPISAADVKASLSTHSLWLLEFYLTEYMSGSLPESFLKRAQTYFDAIRGGGAKALVRFAYRDNRDNPEMVMDPEVSVVLKHIEQLKPILQKNEDVIFVLQAGFIGTWGEWYYTTHFNNLSSRKQVADALLDALPVSRQVELRTPRYKMSMYGLALKDTITAATAHDASAISRLAGHNDCFGADANDEGTFDGEESRKYWKAETRYTIMGGETCKVSDYCLCPQTLKDLEDYHWTYLHDGYNEDVLSRWKTNGCYNEIRSRLGYRLVLQDVHYGAVEAGKPCKVTIRLNNKGFAAPMNPREAWLVWVTSTGKKEKTLLGDDPRTWHSGFHSIVTTFTPSTAKGTLYLELSDPLLSDNPAYSLVFANKGVFDKKTGYNKLFEVK